ncbi:stage V sporulation protein B [Paenibacillus antri]|uniref:Stage V sporulation protein B n=1 Tax=Paenibacillus antri TaxID=2582848 RepID=A0A5R9GND0_9BACL|nr:stage V sporulation protein B [Paenibacillus antri]TLS53565.1 stage V sporulation protein B [Paenibacillus antri]
MTKQSFIRGTMILLAAGLLNRILGFVPRITLPRVVGAEGVGLYQLGYPLLVVLLTVITGGIPLAVAKLVAAAESEGNERKAKDVLRLSLALAVALAVVFTGALLLGARWMSQELLNDERVYYTLLAMSPMLLIVGVSAVFRGYFQGRQNMVPTALSQTAETVARIIAMLVFAYFLLPYGVAFAAAGAMFGVTVGEVCGLAVIVYQYFRTRSAYKAYHTAAIGVSGAPRRLAASFKEMLRIAVPVTGSRMVGSASYFLESVMTVKALAIAGVAVAAATTQYGSLQGMVIPVLLLPGVLTYSLSVSLVPTLAEAAARGDTRLIHKRLHQSLRLALVSGAPFAVLMYVLAEPICFYLYNDAEVGGMLKLMAPVAVFLYFQGPLQATLQALDRPGTALLNTFYGAAIKLTLIYLLATQPEFGIYGVLAAINVNIALVTILHWNSVVRLVKYYFPLGDVLKTAVAAGASGWAAHAIFLGEWHPSPLLRFLSAGVGAVALYLVFVVLLKLVDKDDVGRLPFPRRK